MIAKRRQIPLIVFEIDAILRRLDLFHPKRAALLEDRRIYMAGYNGEKQIDYHLESYNKGNSHFFADLRLIIENCPFQMDNLIVTINFLIIIETKNIAGTLTFEKDSSQMIRELNGNIQGFKNPIIQVAKQKRRLIAWLKKNKFPSIPIIDLVGIADRRTIIKTTPDNRQIFEKLIHADMLEEKINQLEARYATPQLNTRQINKLNQLLLKEHTPAPPSILKKHGILESELTKGNQCINCEHYPLIRISKKWYCRNCKSYSKTAHIKGVHDYFLIISTTITNKLCREFLLVESPTVAKRILWSLKLKTSGSNKNRIYHRPQNL